jgi:hypothetical protein
MLSIAHVRDLPAVDELTQDRFAARPPGTASGMWGRSLGLVALPFALLLLLIAIAFGTSALLFSVLIAAGIVLGIAIVYGVRRGRQRTSHPGEPGGPGRPSGAPVAGEGSGSPLAPSGTSSD